MAMVRKGREQVAERVFYISVLVPDAKKVGDRCFTTLPLTPTKELPIKKNLPLSLRGSILGQAGLGTHQALLNEQAEEDGIPHLP